MTEDKPVEKTEEQIIEEKIDRANAAAERLEKANQVQADLISRQEALNLLGGQSEAGHTPKGKTKKQIAREEASKLVAGTGLDPFADAGEAALGED